MRKVSGVSRELGLPFDPIDRAARIWERRFGPSSAMAAVTSIMRAQQLLLGELDAILRPYGLTFARYEALVLLSFSREGALPLRVMGERLMVHPTSVTNTIDRLEAQGMVIRRPNPADGRGRLAEITERGRDAVQVATRDLMAAEFGLSRLLRTRPRGAVHPAPLAAPVGRRLLGQADPAGLKRAASSGSGGPARSGRRRWSSRSACRFGDGGQGDSLLACGHADVGEPARRRHRPGRARRLPLRRARHQEVDPVAGGEQQRSRRASRRARSGEPGPAAPVQAAVARAQVAPESLDV